MPVKPSRLAVKTTCPSCNKGSVRVIGKIPDSNQFAGRTLNYVLSGGNLVVCESCHLYFRFPRLAKKDLDALYRNGNVSNWHSNINLRTDWQVGIDWITSSIANGVILDIGCFDGGFLKNFGSEYVCKGVEAQRDAAKIAESNGIEMLNHDFSMLSEITETFDAVVAFDLIEHVHDPLSFLRLMADITHSGGHVVVSSGDTDALSWKLLGSKYYYCANAEHISFINQRWCEQAAKSVGLELLEVRKFSHAPSNHGRSFIEAVKNSLYGLFPGIFSSLRSSGIGKYDSSMSESLSYVPPSWGSARNHIIARFIKS